MDDGISLTKSTISELDSQIVKLINQRLLLTLNSKYRTDPVELAAFYVRNNFGPISNASLIKFSSILMNELKLIDLISGIN